MLKLEKISKNFGDIKALQDISFNVQPNKIFGLIGPNGAGKTTTLRIILGILMPTEGEITYLSNNLDSSFLNLTGYLPEERGLYPKSTVFDTLTYFAQLKGMSSNEAKLSILNWLERLDLSEYKNNNIEKLSKGNQQKVQFIASIVHNPKVLVLDEPFSGFDPVNQTIFTEIIKELKNDRIIILSTHIMDLAENLCDDIFMINNGKEVLYGNVKDIINVKKTNLYKIIFENEQEVEKFVNCYNVNNYDDFTVIINLQNENKNTFLKELTNSYNVVSFTEIKPTLHEIFIKMANNNEL